MPVLPTNLAKLLLLCWLPSSTVVQLKANPCCSNALRLAILLTEAAGPRILRGPRIRASSYIAAAN